MNQESKRKIDELFAAFSCVADGKYVFICDVKEDYSRWSKAAVDFFGLPDEYMEKAGTKWINHIHPDDRDEYSKSIDEIFSGKIMSHDMQYRAKSRDGSYSVCTCQGAVIKDADGNPKYFCGAIKNHGIINYTDNVTLLRSLYGFFEDLRALFYNKETASILQIGISNFSAFNDIYGYTFGNRILQKFARLLKNNFTDKGEVYRLDGCKFAIITKDLSQKEIEDVYANLREYVSSSFKVDDQQIDLSINAGEIVLDNFDISDKTIYSCLKYAYYESKNSLMGKIYVFKDEINDNNRRMLEQINEIRNSVSDDCRGFFLCYQPIIHADTETLKGMEALLRWKNDTYGMVPPDRFIPVLEQDANFPVLGDWILRTAMTDAKKFMEKYPDIIMNINLSYAQIQQEGFVENVLNLIDELNIPPQSICLEITERCRLVDTELLHNVIDIFRSRGIKIALDDFGTGFSTLGILRDIEVDSVKIDRSYVRNIETSKIDRSTVRCITEVADAFDTDVCVEGIENRNMIEVISHFKVDSFQGYYYSKPIPFDEFMNKDFKK